MSKNTEIKKLLLETHKHGELLIEVPASWKVTFGPFLSKDKDRWERSSGYVLRIYETEKQQRACFVDVISFRDLSIPVKKRVKTIKNKSRSERDSKGNSASVDETNVYLSDWEDL